MTKHESADAGLQWQPVQLGNQFCVWGGRLGEPRALVETKEIPTKTGHERFVHFALGKQWVAHVLGTTLKGKRSAEGCGGNGTVHGRAWKELVESFKAKTQDDNEGAAVAADGAAVAAPQEEDANQQEEDPMDKLVVLRKRKPAKPEQEGPKKKQKVLGRLMYVRVREKCPLAFPSDNAMRQVPMISFKKNEYWVCQKDLPWLFERLRSENDLAGVPLVENPDMDLAAVAAPAISADSQESLFSTDCDEQTPEKTCRPPTPVYEADSVQGTVDVGYKLQWRFPDRGDQGKWEATVTCPGTFEGKVVECKVAKFTRVKWLQVHPKGCDAPCLWHKATPLQLKEACRLYLEAHMAKIVADLPA